MKLTDISKVELPRERLARYGSDKLTNEQLLAMLLRTGTEGMNVLEVANLMFKRFPGASLAQASVEDLAKIPGIGPVKAGELVACFELGRRLLKDKQVELVLSPRDAWEQLVDIRGEKKEHFVVFFLDTQNQVVKREIVSVGTLNASLVHPREVFEPAVRYLASHVIVVHNHPAGSLLPSEEDLLVTRRLKDAGTLLGIQLLDHVIVTASGYYSLKEHNEL